MRTRAFLTSLTAAALAGCTLVVGVRDLDVDPAITDGSDTDRPPPNGADGGDTDRPSPNDEDGGDTDRAAPDRVTLGGEVHFLRAGESLDLELAPTASEPARRATIVANGPFTLPFTLPRGASYALSVNRAPSGRSCWLRRGSGTAAANVTDVDVRCLVIAKSVSGTNQQSTASTAYVDLPGISPISFETDLPESRVMVSLFVPSITCNYGNGYTGEARLALDLDGAIVAETTRQTGVHGMTGAAYLLDVVVAGPGPHVLTAKWRRGPLGDLVNAPLVSAPPYGPVHPKEMTMTVLDSLSTYDRTLSSSTSSESVSMTTSEVPFTGLTDLAFTPAASQPALVILHVPGLRSEVFGEEVGARTYVDGALLAGGSTNYQTASQARTVVGLAELGGGTQHTFAARFSGGGASPVVRTQPLRTSLNTVVFSPAARRATAIREGASLETNATSFSAPSSGSFGLTLDASGPAKALIVASLGAVLTATHGTQGEIAIFVNGAPARVAAAQNTINDEPSTIVTVADLATGQNAIDLRMRRLDGDLVRVSPRPRVNLTAVVLE